MTSLVGRESEIATVCALLGRADVRLLTLTGPGGVGKTRLATASAERLRDTFPDGVVVVLLAPLSDHMLVIPTISAALGIAEASDATPLDRLTASIGGRRLLLVIDNVEHVMSAAASVGELLVQCPALSILATSRMPLHLYGEREYPVPPLGLPAMTAPVSSEDVSDSPAMTLFVERVRASQPDFVVTRANAAAIAAICHRLDGLPLAIELAAARCKIFPPDALLARLEHPLALLTGGPRDAPDRQQTLRHTIAWSYDLLNDDEQALFRRLSVFVGGFTLAAAESVCAGWDDARLDIIDGLVSLADKSLIAPRQPATEEPEDAPRFGMLETIREFGLEQLTLREERDEAQRRHALYVQTWAGRSAPDWQTRRQLIWLRRGDVELDNLRTALGWATERDCDLALRLNRAIFGYWLSRGYYNEGRRWLDLGLNGATAIADATRADALWQAGFLATIQADYAAGQAMTEESMALYQRLNDARGAARAVNGLARVAMYEGDLEQADWLFGQSNGMARDLGDTDHLVNGLGNLGSVMIALGDLERAAIYLDEALVIARERGDLVMITIQTSDRALLAVAQGERELASTLLAESLTTLRAFGDPRIAAQILEIRAWLASIDNQPIHVAQLLGAAERLRASSGTPIPTLLQGEYEQYVPPVKAQLDAETWDAAWAEGRAMSLDQALAYALEVIERSPTEADPPEQATALSVLSKRELEVLRLLADGRTNQEIAATLFISPHTVSNHVANIMNKLGLESRTAAATWAVRQGLA